MGKLTNINNLDKLSKALDARYKELIDEEKARAIAQEQILQAEIDITKDMFGGKSIKYVTQAEYDILTEEEKNSDTVTYFITDAVDLSHEHENKEFLDGLSQEMLDEIQMYTNVLTLGVKNDGTEDCTIIINDALSEGKSLYFPKGKYLLEYIELQSYNVLIGENDHETILIPNTTTRKSFMNINKGPCQHVRMENFTINHSSNIGQICMDFTSRFPDEGYQHGGLWNSIFKNIHIDSANNGWNGVGLLLAGPSQGHNLLPNQ